MATTEFTIEFYRSQAWERRFEKAGVRKPAGMVISDIRYPDRDKAQETIDHVNGEEPEKRCKLIVLKNGVMAK